MTTTNRPPLWQALKAADASWTSDYTIPEARAIKAVRDWIMAELATDPEDEGWGLPDLIELRNLKTLLTTEADRAERGEVQ